MDNYSTQNFDSCMVAAGNQQCNISPSVNNQPQTEQVQSQEDHNKQQQQMEQTQQIQSNSRILTSVRLPAILDGEYFTVTKLEDTNVTVRCSHCKRHLNGNLKSTGNFLSHIKRVHPLLIDRIKCKSSQRKPATLLINPLVNEKSSDASPVTTRNIKRYKEEKTIDEEGTIVQEDSYEPSTDWNDTTFNRRRLVNEEPEATNQLRVTSHNTFVMEDEYDAIGRNVAAKLRNMRMDQRIIAEKLLNDILFEAQLSNLSRDSNIHV